MIFLIRLYVFTFFILTTFFQAFGQKRKLIDVEPSCLEIVFKQTIVVDTTETQQMQRLMNLRIGPTMSMYYSKARMAQDSLSVVNPNLAFELTLDVLRNNAPIQPFRQILKNYPKGHTTELDFFGMEAWLYEEPQEKPNWELLDSIQSVCGYDCYLASTFFRGRKWYAWFAPDIPISDGPWKLWGLPGLILQAHDDKRHYQYLCMSIVSNPKANVGFYDYQNHIRMKTTRDKYFQSKYNHLQHKNESRTIGFGYSPDTRINVKSTPNNYDFEETNYPHK